MTLYISYRTSIDTHVKVTFQGFDTSWGWENPSLTHKQLGLFPYSSPSKIAAPFRISLLYLARQSSCYYLQACELGTLPFD